MRRPRSVRRQARIAGRGTDVYHLDDMDEHSRVSGEAAGQFRALLPELLVAVDERMALESRFECSGIGCEQLELSREYNRQFGRTLLAVHEFGLVEQLPVELGWLVSFLSRRGFGPDYFNHLLSAWSVAVTSLIPTAVAREHVAPLDRLRGQLGVMFEGRPSPSPALSTEAATFLETVRARRRREAAAYLGKLVSGQRPIEVVLGSVFVPALQHVGRMWEDGSISAADEHAVTDICRYAALRLFDEQAVARPLGTRALVACVPGEEHALGAELVAEYLAAKGWDVFAVGHSAPQEDIVRAVRSFEPDVVFASVTMIANLPAARELMGALPECRFLLGGRAAVLARVPLTAMGGLVVEGLEACHAAALRLAGRDA
jgi:MerR family transcriptional regulator, light-induced transcriptional regulator